MKSFITLILFSSLLACQPQTAERSEVKVVDQSLKNIDLLQAGSFGFDSYDYAMAPQQDPDMPRFTDDTQAALTDIRGSLVLPRGPGPFPIALFLHGNHSTCGTFPADSRNPHVDRDSSFSSTGTCPEGMAEVQSHKGYQKSAELLASHGYAVVLVNANRGINAMLGPDSDPSLIYARGILVLRHLEELQKWSQESRVPAIKGADVDLRAKLDFSQVGLMGHSRGGEGVRYAYNILNYSSVSAAWQKRLPNLRIKGIFEVGPVDVGASYDPMLNMVAAEDVDWAVLIPACDNDISDYMGVRPFERMLARENPDAKSKAVFALWGANHNFFNSEWQVSDAPHDCGGRQKPLWDTSMVGADTSVLKQDGLKGSLVQQSYLSALMLAFFKAHVGRQTEEHLAHVFDPQYALPDQLDALAPSSREYFKNAPSVNVFDVKTALKGAVAGVSELLAYADRGEIALDTAFSRLSSYKGYEKLKLLFFVDLKLRPAIVIESEAGQGDRPLTIPFTKAQDAAGFWTLDMTLAQIQLCYEDFGLPCRGTAAAAFDLALLYEDGTESAAVSSRDYVSLAPDAGLSFEQVRTEVEKDGETLAVTMQSKPILYQSMRVELKDFGTHAAKIVGVKLKMQTAGSPTLAIQGLRLTRKDD